MAVRENNSLPCIYLFLNYETLYTNCLRLLKKHNQKYKYTGSSASKGGHYLSRVQLFFNTDKTQFE